MDNSAEQVPQVANPHCKDITRLRPLPRLLQNLQIGSHYWIPHIPFDLNHTSPLYPSGITASADQTYGARTNPRVYVATFYRERGLRRISQGKPAAESDRPRLMAGKERRSPIAERDERDDPLSAIVAVVHRRHMP